MADVFIRYGNSTKRADNSQTGGFGLGAKSPFAYSDTFGIISVTPEESVIDENGTEHNNVLVKRQYVAVIDPSRVGKMTLQSSEITTEEQGTTIVITCKPNDYENFKRHVTEVAQYWEVKPTIKGVSNFAFPKFDSDFNGSNWNIEKKDGDYYNNHLNKPFAIVDGISYPINTSNLFKEDKLDYSMSNLLQNRLRLHFKTGEILMTANREEIDYQPNVIKVLRERISNALKEIKVLASDKLKNAVDLYDANVQWKNIRRDYNKIIEGLDWNGIKLNPDGIYLRDYQAVIYHFTKYNNTISRKTGYYVSFTEKSLLTVEDSDQKTPSKAKIATLFYKNPDVANIYVLVFNSSDAKVNKDNEEKFNKQFNFDKFNAIKLSTVDKKKFTRTATGVTVKASKPRVYLKEVSSWSWIDSTADITTATGYYVTYKDRKATISHNNKVWDIDTDFAQNFKGLKVGNLYALSDKYKGTISPNLKPLATYLEEIWKKENSVSVDNSDYSKSFEYCLWNIKSLSTEICNLGKTNVLREYCEYSNEYSKKNHTSDKKFLMQAVKHFFGDNTNKNNKLNILFDSVQHRYPLLFSIHRCDDAQVKKDIILYIESVDKVR